MHTTTGEVTEDEKQTVLDTKAAQDTRKDVHTTTMTKTNTRTQLAGGTHRGMHSQTDVHLTTHGERKGHKHDSTWTEIVAPDDNTTTRAERRVWRPHRETHRTTTTSSERASHTHTPRQQTHGINTKRVHNNKPSVGVITAQVVI